MKTTASWLRLLVMGAALAGLGAPLRADIPGKSDTPAARQARKAKEALEKGDLGGAEAAFLEALKLDPGMVGAMLGLGDVAERRGQVAEAEKQYKAAAAKAPHFAGVQEAWGSFLYKRGRFAEAEAPLKKATELNKESVSAWIALGDVYLRGLKKPEPAAEAYRKAIALDATKSGARYGLGLALVQVGKRDEAQAAFEESSRLAPENPLPLHALARLQLERKDAAKAMAALDATLKAEPTFVPALLDRGDLYAGRGETEKALQDFAAAARVQPKNPLPPLKRGMAFQAAGKSKEAKAAYLDAAQLDPRQAVAYNNLAWMAAEQGTDLDQALEWAKKAVELGGKVAPFHGTLAEVHRVRKELPQALAAQEKAVAIDPRNPVFQYRLGLIALESGARPKARAAFETALSLSKDFPGAQDARQRLAELGRPAPAKK